MNKHNALQQIAYLSVALLMFTSIYYVSDQHAHAYAQTQSRGDSRTFPETGHTVEGRFLDYWEQHGGLMQQGYPLTEEMQEVSEVNGKRYTVQYFERAVFELHPENQPPYDILLSLLGAVNYKEHYPNGAPNQKPNDDPSSVIFSQTGKHLGGSFLAYWQGHGGLMQQGYPISDEFEAISPLDGKQYMMQYFERAVFELHPENQGTPYEVLLSQLGTFKYKERYVAQSQMPTVPPPATGNRQFSPRGSDRYLVWNEAGVSLDTYDLRGLDLKTNKVFTVSDAPSYQGNPQLSGSLIVWEDTRHSCGTCDRDILGKDLETGVEFTVADGPADQLYPAIAGRNVIWVESNETASKLLLKNLDTNAVSEIASVPKPSELRQPAMSDQYVLWAQVGEQNQSTRSRPVQLQAYNRTTGMIKTVAQFTQPAAISPSYAISGENVVWNDDGVRFANLGSGEVATLYNGAAFALVSSGSFVIWAITPPTPAGASGFDIYGVNLQDKEGVARLVTGGNTSGEPAIAGDWLVWQTKGGKDDGRFSFQMLTKAFGRK